MKVSIKLYASIAFLGCVGVSSPSIAGDLYVIANLPGSLAGDEVRDVFFGEKQIAGGTKLTPVDNGSLQKDFLEKALKVDATKYASIWTKKGFRDGLNPPSVKSGDAEVIAVVKSTPGAIGYVSGVPSVQTIKVIQKY